MHRRSFGAIALWLTLACAGGPKGPPKPPESLRGWRVHAETSAMDDTTTTTATLYAEEGFIDLLGGGEALPHLIVTCGPKGGDLIMINDAFVDALDGEDVTVRMRFDGGPPETVAAFAASFSVGFDKPEAIVEKIAASDVMLYEFTPRGNPSTIVTFKTAKMAGVPPQVVRCPKPGTTEG